MRMKDKNHENDESESDEGSNEVFHRSLPLPPIEVNGTMMLRPHQKRKNIVVETSTLQKSKRQRFKPLKPDH